MFSTEFASGIATAGVIHLIGIPMNPTTSSECEFSAGCANAAGEQPSGFPTVVATAPTEIYLDLGEPMEDGATFQDLHEVTWSAKNATGCGIRYVRADQHADNQALGAGYAAARLEIESLRVQLSAQRGAPMFWVRLRSDGGYEGPIPDASIEEVRKHSGAWLPLHLFRASGSDGKPAQPPKCELTVHYGSMPESNGRENWTATVYRKNGGNFWEDLADGVQLARSEYPDRVRYFADRMRYLLGELEERPDIRQYDADRKSPWIPPELESSAENSGALELGRMLAEQVLSMGMITQPGVRARELARQVLSEGAESPAEAVLRAVAKRLGLNAPKGLDLHVFETRICEAVEKLESAAGQPHL